MKMEGEELRVLERLIVAPAVGVFEPVEAHDGVTGSCWATRCGRRASRC